MKVDLLITHAAQLITCASPGGPLAGAAMAEIEIIPDGAVAIDDERIVAVGSSAELSADYQARQALDASGQTVCPGFIDAHTHVVYAGERLDEFELRIQGATYMEIMQAGGGILSSMRATRAADLEALVAVSRARLDQMLALGTTTVEVKTGYGLDLASELKMLEAIRLLDAQHPCDLAPTFLGAHAVPPEFAGRAEEYLNLVIEAMLPAAAEWFAGVSFKLAGTRLANDIFCEANVFDRQQSERLLRAGLALGMPPKIHADEFTNLGGLSLAIELEALCADHLDVTPPEEYAQLAGSKTVAVVIPGVNFNLGSRHYADGRGMIDAGAALALATDINPGSAPCPSMPLVMVIASRYQRLLPAETLHASTINAAYAIGAGEELGSIEVGKQADLLVIDVPDYRHLAYQMGGNLVQRVIKRGRIVI